MSKRFKAKTGFTLVEMLVVIVIILILAGIMLRIGGLVNDRTARSRTVSRLEHLKNAVEGYYTIYGIYPPVTKVRWIEPGGSAGAEDGWDTFLKKARQANPEWENPDKQYWDALYPFIYRDDRKAAWKEFSDQAGGGGAGIDTNEADSASIGDGFEWGKIIYTNNVYSIKDGWGNDFTYRVGEDYQTYELYSSGSDGKPVGQAWSE